MMFLRRFNPLALPVGWCYTLAYAARLVLRDRAVPEAQAVLSGAFGLPAPRAIRNRLGPEAAALAFGVVSARG
jgi:hypothetical protein